MRIVWLFERTDQLWGGVKVALTDANWLSDHGHEVTVVSRTAAPEWMRLRCRFQQVVDLTPATLPPADVVIGTFWTTVDAAAAARANGAAAVHFCQGYEGDAVEPAHRARIEAIYRLPDLHRITIAPHLTQMLKERFGIDAHEVVYAVDHETHYPGPPKPPSRRVRIGLVGPYEVPWKDIATGLAACRLAAAAGLDLELVRVTNTSPHRDEQNLPFPVEWHQRVPPAEMGAIYRSLHAFLGTSSGAEEGFFLPAVEAMACGVPCVLTDVPCFRSHGRSSEAANGSAQEDGGLPYALFVPPRDAAAMAEAMVLASRSSEIGAALRQGGLRIAQRYTQEAHGRALLHVLEAVTDRRPAPSMSPSPAATAGDDDDLVELTIRLTRELRHGADLFEDKLDHERAAAFRAAAHCLCPGDAALAADAAWSLHLAGDTAAALRRLDSLVAEGNDHATVHERRAFLLNATGQPAAAAQAFRAAIAAGLRNADAYNNLGIALYRTGDLAGARSSFERALVIEPDHQDAQANVADLPVA